MPVNDELRALLDERNVGWVESQGGAFTWWISPIFGRVVAMENDDGTLELFDHAVTPLEAVVTTIDAVSLL